MKRTNKHEPVDAILTADWHLRDTVPSCRTDDFIESQWEKVREVARLQKENDCPVFHAGDLFHHWKPSPELLSRCIRDLPKRFCTVYGNHDLPQHSMELEYKSGVRTLIEAGVVELLREGHWNHPPEVGERLQYDDHESDKGHGFRKLAIWHNMVWTNKAPFPGAEDEDEGHKLLEQYPDFDLILTGDNHTQFICKSGGRILLNAGNLTRQTADQKNFEPCVWLYNAKENSVRAHYFDVDPDDVTRVYIDKKNARDERITAFVERLNTDWEGAVDFKENVRQLITKNKINDSVSSLVYQALDSE